MRRHFTTFGRIIHVGARNFIRNAWLSTAATAVMLVTLTILLSSFAINKALTDTIADIAQNVTLSVYLEEDVSDDQRSELELTLQRSFNVESVDYLSAQEALAIFQENNADDPSLLEGVNVIDTKLPASLEVTVLDLGQLDSVIEVAQQPEFEGIVNDTSASEDRLRSIDRIAGAQEFIVIASLAAAALFGSISILIIFNTIRMAVFTRQEEIEIMKLTGATPGYIRGPFLFEATMYGVIAGVLSLVSVFSALLVLGPKSTEFLVLDPTIDFFVEQWYTIFIVTIGGGIMIGFISSALAMNKYLRIRKW